MLHKKENPKALELLRIQELYRTWEKQRLGKTIRIPVTARTNLYLIAFVLVLLLNPVSGTEIKPFRSERRFEKFHKSDINSSYLLSNSTCSLFNTYDTPSEVQRVYEKNVDYFVLDRPSKTSYKSTKKRYNEAKSHASFEKAIGGIINDDFNSDDLVDALNNAPSDVSFIMQSHSLSLATMLARERIVKRLLSAGVDANAGVDILPLQIAASYGLDRIVTILLEHGAKASLIIKGDTINNSEHFKPTSNFAQQNSPYTNSPFYRKYKPYSRLEIAAKYDPKSVKDILEEGDSPNEYNFAPPLALALDSNNHEAAVILMQYHANLNYIDPGSGYSYLHFAILTCPQSIPSLLSKGADLNYSVDNLTALHLAAKNNSYSVEVLLRNGANKNIQNSQLETPAHIAVKFNRPEALAILLNQGANPNITNSDGETVLHSAVKRFPAAVPLILQHNPDLETKDKYSDSPVISAITNKDKVTTKLLLEKNASIDEYKVMRLLKKFSNSDLEKFVMLLSPYRLQTAELKKVKFLTALHYFFSFLQILVVFVVFMILGYFTKKIISGKKAQKNIQNNILKQLGAVTDQFHSSTWQHDESNCYKLELDPTPIEAGFDYEIVNSKTVEALEKLFPEKVTRQNKTISINIDKFNEHLAIKKPLNYILNAINDNRYVTKCAKIQMDVSFSKARCDSLIKIWDEHKCYLEDQDFSINGAKLLSKIKDGDTTKIQRQKSSLNQHCLDFEKLTHDVSTQDPHLIQHEAETLLMITSPTEGGAHKIDQFLKSSQDLYQKVNEAKELLENKIRTLNRILGEIKDSVDKIKRHTISKLSDQFKHNPIVTSSESLQTKSKTEVVAIPIQVKFPITEKPREPSPKKVAVIQDSKVDDRHLTQTATTLTPSRSLPSISAVPAGFFTHKNVRIKLIMPEMPTGKIEDHIHAARFYLVKLSNTLKHNPENYFSLLYTILRVFSTIRGTILHLDRGSEFAKKFAKQRHSFIHGVSRLEFNKNTFEAIKKDAIYFCEHMLEQLNIICDQHYYLHPNFLNYLEIFITRIQLENMNLLKLHHAQSTQNVDQILHEINLAISKIQEIAHSSYTAPPSEAYDNISSMKLMILRICENERVMSENYPLDYEKLNNVSPLIVWTFGYKERTIDFIHACRIVRKKITHRAKALPDGSFTDEEEHLVVYLVNETLKITGPIQKLQIRTETTASKVLSF